MNMYSSILDDDLQFVVKSIEKYKPLLEGKTVLVTGATGLIGSLLVKSFLKVGSIKVIACVRNLEKANSIFDEYKNTFLKFYVGDITEPIILESPIDYIFHCAAITNSRLMVEKPIDTIFTSIDGTKNVLELARIKQSISVVYISSMEMYGVCSDFSKKISEDDIGYLNPLLVRSNYPESKRLCENLCVAYSNEYDIDVKIARLSQTFGAGINKNENRVFAQFARSIIENKDIVLHTTGLSEGNYCYTSDCICGLITILLEGKSCEAYNVVNELCHSSIKGMADLLVENFNNSTNRVVFDIDSSINTIYAPENHMILSSEKLQKLGWKPKYDLLDSYKRLIKYMLEVFY